MTSHDRHPFLRRLMVLGSASCSCTSRPASFGGRARTIAQKFSPVLKKRESLEPCLSGFRTCPFHSSTVIAHLSWSRQRPATFRYRGENPSSRNPHPLTSWRDASLSG